MFVLFFYLSVVTKIINENFEDCSGIKHTFNVFLLPCHQIKLGIKMESQILGHCKIVFTPKLSKTIVYFF